VISVCAWEFYNRRSWLIRDVCLSSSFRACVREGVFHVAGVEERDGSWICCSIYISIYSLNVVQDFRSDLYQYIYMLFAGWEVRIVTNCDRGLKNAARGKLSNEKKNSRKKNSRKRYCERGQRQENPDCAKNQSDCRVPYRARLEKIIRFKLYANLSLKINNKTNLIG